MDRARDEMNRLKNEALDMLDELGGSSESENEAREALRELIEYTIRRVKRIDQEKKYLSPSGRSGLHEAPWFLICVSSWTSR